MLRSTGFLRQRVLTPIPEASAAIFGNRIGDGMRSGWKVLHSTRRGPAINTWYNWPKGIDFRKGIGIPSETQEARWMRTLRRMKRGLMPVKKGQGKRTQKAKGTSKAVATPQAPTQAAKADQKAAKK